MNHCKLTECQGKPECDTCKSMRRNCIPRFADAEAMGAAGGTFTDAERLAFEAWMRGHCWALCATWDGKQYVSEGEIGTSEIDPLAMMTRRMWAAWRDRAALARNLAHNVF